MISFLQVLLEQFPLRNICYGFQFLSQLQNTLICRPLMSFNEKLIHLQDLLETQDETSDVVNRVLTELKFFSPHIQIIPEGVWPKESTNRICIQTHLKSTFMDAVRLLQGIRHDFSFSDEKYLRLLLTHTCGWSATYSEHMTDDWVAFFKIRYPQLKGLVPILDSMTYQEELSLFPIGFVFYLPQFFLLTTSDCFYIYDATDNQDGLRIAGNTLEEVYIGLMEWRWADSSENPWDFLEEAEYLSPSDHFPAYYTKENGNFGMWGGPESQRNMEIPRKGRLGLWSKWFYK